MEKLYTFAKARLWVQEQDPSNEEDYYGGDWATTIFVEGSNEPNVLSFQAYDVDGYRSNLSTDFKLPRLQFVYMPNRKLIGEFENVEVIVTTHEDFKGEEDDDYWHEEDYICYTIYSNGEEIASASEDASDSYYPSAGVSILNHEEYEKEIQTAPKNFEYKIPSHLEAGSGKRAFIVTGEPRLGKTTTLAKHLKSMFTLDSDSYQDPKTSLAYLAGYKDDFAFVIGKYRNTVVETPEGEFLFKDMAKHILKKKGYTVYELEFVERKGVEYNGYAIVISNQTNQKLYDVFESCSKTTEIGKVSERRGELPDDSYIFAKLKKTV